MIQNFKWVIQSQKTAYADRMVIPKLVSVEYHKKRGRRIKRLRVALTFALQCKHEELVFNSKPIKLSLKITQLNNKLLHGVTYCLIKPHVSGSF